MSSVGPWQTRSIVRWWESISAVGFDPWFLLAIATSALVPRTLACTAYKSLSDHSAFLCFPILPPLDPMQSRLAPTACGVKLRGLSYALISAYDPSHEAKMRHTSCKMEVSLLNLFLSSTRCHLPPLSRKATDHVSLSALLNFL
jgi:hypothetical protein